MKYTSAFAAFLASWTTVTAHDSFISSLKNSQGHDPINGKEMVILHERENGACNVRDAMAKAGLKDSDAIAIWDSESGLCGAHLESIGEHCQLAFGNMSEVRHLEEKVEIRTFLTQKTGSPWGLQRISNDAGASGSAQGQDFTYSFEDPTLGQGVNIYVIDTGVRQSHAVFTGRAIKGFPENGTADDDEGHGTHVAGTAAGAKFGVAQGANITAVKVLDSTGAGASGTVLAGMDWAMQDHAKRRSQPGFKGSIFSMSWGLSGTTSAVIDAAVQDALEAGIHISVAAGNDGADACRSTPSRNGGANSAVVSVGAVNIQNKISTFSNTGPCVDIYAPGEQVLSSWNTADNAINFLSGTSMACPHTTGVMAYLLAQDVANLGQNPAALKKKLLATARQNQIVGGNGTLLLSNGVNGGVAAKRLMKDYVVPDTDVKRTVTGGPANWAKHLVDNLGKRWEVYSTESPLRY